MPKRAYHFSDDLLPGSQLTTGSEDHLVKLMKDTLQPEIARATSAHYLGSLVTQSSADALIGALNDKKALVRYHVLRALENFPADVWRDNAHRALSDKVRAVRIAAADLYHTVSQEAVPPSARGAFGSADAENKRYLQSQTDFAVGNVMLADYELQGGDRVNAIAHYVRGLSKDSLMNYARFNLSAAYNGIGKNAEAMRVLENAIKIDPQNDRAFYSLGLLHYELGNNLKAEEAFRKGVVLVSANTGLYYNYGLLLQQLGKAREAENILLKGYALDPRAANINYALTFLYLNQNNPKKALLHAQVQYSCRWC